MYCATAEIKQFLRLETESILYKLCGHYNVGITRASVTK